ncbi:MAG: DsrE family protein [Nitrospirae bacterium]|nr:DsrE family protein [Nitrospirota bacterium]
MRRETKVLIRCLLISVCLLCITAGASYGEGYKALDGLKSVKAVFDFRAGNPKGAAMQLDMIYKILHDKSITTVTEKPEFAVVFIGPSVKLISKTREGFPPEELKSLDEIAATVSRMAKEGVRLEICLAAAKIMGVDPSSILPEIARVENGWISLIGYQAKDYSIVPAY